MGAGVQELKAVGRKVYKTSVACGTKMHELKDNSPISASLLDSREPHGNRHPFMRLRSLNTKPDKTFACTFQTSGIKISK